MSGAQLAERLSAKYGGPAKAKAEEDKGGLLNNVKNLAGFFDPRNLSKAVAGIGAEAASTVKEVGRILPTTIAAATMGSTEADLKSMDSSPLAFLTNTSALRKAKEDAPVADKIMGQLNEFAPLIGHGAEAFAQTGINLGDVAARGISQTGAFGPRMDFGESEYAKRFAEGQLGPTLVGDMLNLGLAGKGAAFKGAVNPIPEALGTKIGAGAAKLERLPFAPYTAPAGALRKAVGKAAEGGSLLDGRLAGVAERPLLGAPLRTVDAGVNQLGKLKQRSDLRGDIATEGAAAVSPLTAMSGDIQKAAKATSVAEQEAAQLVRMGMPESNLALADRLMQTEAGLAGSGLEGMITTPESIGMARAYHAGDAGVKAQLDQAINAVEPAAGVMKDAYLEGVGLRGTSTAEQRAALSGDQLLTDLIDRDLAKTPVAQELAGAERMAAAVPGAAEKMQSYMDDLRSKVADERSRLEADPRYAPAAHRPALRAGEQMQQAARTQAEALTEAGYPDAAAALTQDLDSAVTRFSQMEGQTPGAVIGGRLGDTLKAPSKERLGQTKVGSEFEKSGVTADLSLKGQYNSMLHRLHEMGMNEAKAKIVEKFGRAEQVADDWMQVNELGVKVKEGGTWIPKNVLKAFDDMERTVPTNAFVKGYDKLLAGAKQSWLPLSPKWQVGNVAGNSIMATLGSGVGPSDWVRYWGDMRKAIKAPDRYEGAVQRRGITDELMRDTGIAEGGALQGGGRYKRSVAAMYRANEWVDNAGHLFSYLKEKDRFLSRGVPEKAASEQAVRKSLQVMGDFTNMSKFERNVVRRTVPFYPWYKHITKLAFNLPIDNPARLAWTMHLSDSFDPNKGEEVPDFLKGSIPLGEGKGHLRVPWNPFPGGGTDSPLTNPASALGSISPLAQWPLAAAGFNAGRGRMLTSAPSERNPDKMGFIGAKEFGGYLLNQFPQARGLADLKDRIGGQAPSLQYDTRQPWLVRGKRQELTTQDVGPVPSPIFQFLTGASFDEPDIPDQLKRTKKKTKQAAQTAKKYEKNLNRG